MRTESIGSHWLVELGWVIATGFIAVATLNLLAKVIVAPTVHRPLPPAAELASLDRSRPVLEAALLAPLLGLAFPESPGARDLSVPQGAPVVGDHTPWLRVREVESTSEVWASPSSPRETGCPLPDRIVPVFREGRAFGFALMRIQPGSPARSLGLVDGDIVRRVNGFEMTSPARALDAYARLKDVDTIVLDLERAGTAIRKTYIRRSGGPLTPSPRPR